MAFFRYLFSGKNDKIKIDRWEDILYENQFLTESIIRKHGLFMPSDFIKEKNEINDIFDKFPLLDNVLPQKESKFKLINIISDDTNQFTYLENFAYQLTNFAKKNNYENFYATLDYPVSWILKNNFEQVVEANNFLYKIGIDDSFNGGFIIPINKLKDILPHLFWLKRCNASLPQIRISIDSLGIVFILTQYFNIHAILYDEKILDDLLKNGDKYGLLVNNEIRIAPSFMDTNAHIEGRIKIFNGQTFQSLGHLDLNNIK